MASPNPPATAASSTGVSSECCSGPTLAYLFLRIMIAMILILAGLEKFKSSTQPYTYSVRNYHGVIVDDVIVEQGRWLPIVKVVFENSGLNNEAFLGEKLSRTIGWGFYAFGQVLPWAMLALGICILLGFLNRICLVLGACLWLSLAAGQAMLPDNNTVSLLLNYAFYTIAALALVKYNRFAITRF